MSVQKTMEIISEALRQYAAFPYDRKKAVGMPNENILQPNQRSVASGSSPYGNRTAIHGIGEKEKKDQTKKEKELENEIGHIEELYTPTSARLQKIFSSNQKSTSELHKH